MITWSSWCRNNYFVSNECNGRFSWGLNDLAFNKNLTADEIAAICDGVTTDVTFDVIFTSANICVCPSYKYEHNDAAGVLTVRFNG
jgi:hypothetical protein